MDKLFNWIDDIARLNFSDSSNRVRQYAKLFDDKYRNRCELLEFIAIISVFPELEKRYYYLDVNGRHRFVFRFISYVTSL